MHEAGIMESALEAACGRARAEGASRIHRIGLRVGTLSGVEPDALRFAFESLSPGTAAAGARLEIDTVPARCRCPDCELEFEVDSGFIFTCPKCRRLTGELSQGREMELTALEIS